MIIQIGDQSVDTADPCAVVDALRGVRLQIATGGVPVVVRFGEDEVRFSKPVLSALDLEIERFERLCAEKQRKSTRSRFAKTIRWS